MYMIEISEDKLHKMAEHIEKGLRHMEKLMQCIEDLKEDSYGDGAYGERGHLGTEEDEDWWDAEDDKYKGNRDRVLSRRMRRY